MKRAPRATRSARRRVAAIGVALVVLATACGGDDGDGPDASAVAERVADGERTSDRDSSDGERSDGEETETTETTDEEAASVTRTLATTGWWGGFAITVDDVELVEEPFGGATVTLNLTYQNLGDQQATPPTGVIEADGEAFEVFADLPNVPGQGVADGSLTATVDFRGDLDDTLDAMTLTFGDAGDNQTLIPLTEDGEVEGLEPKDLGVTGTLTHGEIVVEVVQGGLGPSYESGEKGKAVLDLRIKISCSAACAASGYNTDTSQFSVTAPDGRSSVADSRSLYCCDAIYPGDVSDNEDNVVSFVVSSPGTGRYTLTYDNKAFSGDGTAPATFVFTA